MALPSSRVIGHKEYAAGRKSDPTYSMDWRRQRVAAFTPRNATPEDDMAQVPQAEWDALQKEVKAARADLAELRAALLDRKYVRTGITDEDTVREATLPSLVRYADGNALRARRAVEEQSPTPPAA